MTRYRVTKEGGYWRLYHKHQSVSGNYDSSWTLGMTSSHWGNVMWVATKDPAYMMSGFRLVTRICHSGHGGTS